MDELIINQRDIPEDRWRYGLRPSAKTGCGWIAVYNCLTLLGHPKTPEEIIHGLERQVPGLHGTFGTLCLGRHFAKKMGIFCGSPVGREKVR